MYLKQNLVHLRKQGELTQAEIAYEFGISQQSVSFYENGKREPDLGTLVSLSEFFGVTVDDLLKKDLSKEGKG